MSGLSNSLKSKRPHGESIAPKTLAKSGPKVDGGNVKDVFQTADNKGVVRILILPLPLKREQIVWAGIATSIFLHFHPPRFVVNTSF